MKSSEPRIGTIVRMTWDIADRNVLVTGGNSGIGRATATELARRGADVTITSRDPERGAAAAEEIAREASTRIDVITLDLADPHSVRRGADEYLSRHDHLHVLVNNAGGIFGSRALTATGDEMTLATNHLGPFAFTQFLLPVLVAPGSSRVISVASSGHGFARDGIRFDDITFEAKYSMAAAYGQSKLANILHARELDRRYRSAGVHAYAVHPGLVRTRIGRDGDSLFTVLYWGLRTPWLLTPEEGSDTIVWLASVEEPPEPVGGYFEKREEARSTRKARDDREAERLWEFSEARMADWYG